MKLPSLSSLRFFNAAAHRESFIKAAEDLCVTHSAISRQVRLLEEQLGCELFERRNRAVFLTKKGALLFKTTNSIFEQLEDTVQKINDSQNSTSVSISCEPTIAMKWLIPRLTHFYTKHPEITVNLIAAGGDIDFLKTKADIALRRNDFKWNDDIYAIKICMERMGIVCGVNINDQKLCDEVLLSTATRPTAWQMWQKITGQNFQKNKQLTYEHFYLCIQAALAGQGATLASFLMVEDEIRSGQLVAPQNFIEDGSAYFLLSPKKILPESNIGIFTEWLIAEINMSVERLSLKD